MNLNKDSKLHVCLVNYEYPNETSIGGISTYQKRMADSLIKKGCKVTIIAGALSKNQEYYEDGVHVYRIIKKFPFKNLSNYTEYSKSVNDIIRKINKNNPINIIESPEISAEMLEYQRIRTIPIITKLHTPYFLIRKFNSGAPMFPDNVEKQIFKDEKEVIINSDKIICCTNLLKNLMKKYYSKVNNEMIEVIPNPADITNFYPRNRKYDSKIILYCGSLERRKGIYVLLKAIPIVVETLKDENIIFRFIGKYTNIEKNGRTTKENIMKSINKKYHKNIELLGHIENKKLNKYYNDARIGVVPSLFDNLPYVAMEQLLTELPIIASNNTGIIEMIEHKKSGILYNPTDYNALAKYIIELYNNPEYAKKLGKKGREEILNKFAPDIIAEKMINIYKGVIDEFGRRNN